jgi:hypothetical protein
VDFCDKVILFIFCDVTFFIRMCDKYVKIVRSFASDRRHRYFESTKNTLDALECEEAKKTLMMFAISNWTRHVAVRKAVRKLRQIILRVSSCSK